MSTTDHRSDERKKFDAMVGTSQTSIDLFNEGYEFLDQFWPVGGRQSTAAEAMGHAKFTIIDMSDDAESYWQGYEQACRDRLEAGLPIPDSPTPEDEAWMIGELMRFLKGDRK